MEEAGSSAAPVVSVKTSVCVHRKFTGSSQKSIFNKSKINKYCCLLNFQTEPFFIRQESQRWAVALCEPRRQGPTDHSDCG